MASSLLPPRIACVAIIGKKNSPLFLSTFTKSRDTLFFHFLIHTTLDIFTLRLPSKTNGDSDFGLLYAVDEELACYGWLTNTGIKFVVAVENPTSSGGEDLKPVFRALQTAYIRLVCNPFFENDELGAIKSKRFQKEVGDIVEGWRPGSRGE
ncbi:Sedlin [Ascodesmis nigricans]|uniref:Trafficking protein particle complex subunit 2-like protein n=1 Tax=Ascodesmis nigricans TaxID=341454 RepID=A0A4V3SJ97_9PEZI|nr:Sedlin [Ascodesmis nigricans]